MVSLCFTYTSSTTTVLDVSAHGLLSSTVRCLCFTQMYVMQEVVVFVYNKPLEVSIKKAAVQPTSTVLGGLS